MKHFNIFLGLATALAVLAAGAWYYQQQFADTNQASLEQEVQIEDSNIADFNVANSSDEAEIITADASTSHKPSSATRTQEPTTEPKSETAEPPSLPLPSLNESDGEFIDAAQTLSPVLVAWLLPEHQIRKWVALVDNLANANVPAQDRPLEYPMDAFLADEVLDSSDEEYYFNESNYQRADLLIDTLVSIPPSKLVSTYQQWLPLLEEAYAELGLEQSFNDSLRQAIANILAIESIEQPAALVQPSAMYKYRDSELENADALSKLMWRIGPENLGRIKKYAHQVDYLLQQ